MFKINIIYKMKLMLLMKDVVPLLELGREQIKEINKKLKLFISIFYVPQLLVKLLISAIVKD